jgi:hypothetical protein
VNILGVTLPLFIILAANIKKGTAIKGKLFTPCIIFRGSRVIGIFNKSFSAQRTARHVSPMEAATGTPTMKRIKSKPIKKISINMARAYSSTE